VSRKKARPEEEAFLADIVANPEDDAPRLVYADWLQEHGDEAGQGRAEFIREQVRLEREGGRSTVYPEGSQKATQLHRAHRKEWANGLPEWAARHAGYRRGFIEVVRCTARQFLQGGATLRRLVPLRGVVLERPWGLLDQVADSGLLARLRNLSLVGQLSSVDDLRPLADCRDLDGLTHLHIGRCRFGPDGMKALAQAQWLSGLSYLYLLGNYIEVDGARALASVPFRGLVELDLQANYIGDRGLAALAASRHVLAQLTRLNLAYNALTGAGLRAVASSPATARLSRLALMGNPLGDEGAEALAGSPHLARLQYLGLREVRMSDPGACALAGSPHLAGLVELDLYDNRIVNEGIVALARSPHLARLTRLTLYTRGRVDEDAWKVYVDRFPKH
jgi:uncharacterized protein (TIGR02996 family)